jgi:3-oxoacid CoA-transferase A subunit
LIDLFNTTEIIDKALSTLTANDVIFLGKGIPSLIPTRVLEHEPLIFVTESGLVGKWTISNEPTNTEDSNGNYVTLTNGSVVMGSSEIAEIITGRHIQKYITCPDKIGTCGSFVMKEHGLGFNESLTRFVDDIICVMHLLDDEGNSNFVQTLDDNRIKFTGTGTIITEIAVFKFSPQGLKVTELIPDLSLKDLQIKIGIEIDQDPDMIPMEIPKRCPLGVIDKIFKSGEEALNDVPDGAVVMIDGFAGPGGMAHHLLVSLRDQGAKNLTIISNTAGIARVVNFGTPPGKLVIDHSILIDNKQVKKAIASYPVSPSSSSPSSFELAYKAGEVELELVPQGTLAERLRAGGTGVESFYTPTGAGTLIAEGKDTKIINGKEYIRETGLKADFCVIRGHQADALGNVTYKGTSRNFNAVMAPSATITVVEVDEVVPTGTLDPESIVTSGMFVDRIVIRPKDFSPYE